MSDNILNVSRRGFLQGWFPPAPGLECPPGSGGPVGGRGTGRRFTHADRAALHPSVFVGIDTDGTVYHGGAPLGDGHQQPHFRPAHSGGRTGCGLEAGENRTGDRRSEIRRSGYRRIAFGPRWFYDVMREAGATARLMLTQAAAQQWGVPVSECESDLHVIVHKPTNRKAGYGELAAAAAKAAGAQERRAEVQAEERVALHRQRRDQLRPAEILHRQSRVMAWTRTCDGMVYASVEHPPVLGGKVKSYDEKAPLQVKGVKQTIPIKPFTPPHHFQPLGGVAVIADNTWAAFQGRKKLNVAWDNGPNASYNSDEYKKQLQETARKPARSCATSATWTRRSPRAERSWRRTTTCRTWRTPPMEPPVALADYRDGKVTVWASTQNPQAVQETIAEELGHPQRKRDLPRDSAGRRLRPQIETGLCGRGGDSVEGRRQAGESGVEPRRRHQVRLLPRRFRDVHEGGAGRKGKPTAWLQRSVFPPIGSTFALNTTYGDGGELGLGWTDLPFDLPNHRAENGSAENHVRIGWLRSVANIYHAFAVQSFADELAHDVGTRSGRISAGPDRPCADRRRKSFRARDTTTMAASPAEYPLDTARMRRVIEMAAEKSGWGKRKLGKGSGMGIAVHRSFLTYVATVVEVEVDDKGEVKIPSVHTAVDAGIVVNPEATRAQFEGAAVFGTSIVRSGAITAKDGAIEQSNFNDYPVARMNEAPYKTTVYIVDSDAPPAGVGEPGVPPFAPAVCNAIFAATGKRIRELPLSKA